LSTWLRDYLYIPLGGSRRRTYLNLTITMLLGGLWHGGNWRFVIWGALHGGGLAVTRVFQRLGERDLPRARSMALFTLLGSAALLALHVALAPAVTRLGAGLPIGSFWVHVLLAWLYLTPGWAAASAWLSRDAEDEADGDRAETARPEDSPLAATVLRVGFVLLTVNGLYAVQHGMHQTWLPLLVAWMLVACAADVVDARPDGDRAWAYAGRALRRGFAILLTFHYVCFAWIFFRATTMDGVRAVLEQIAGGATDAVNLSAPFLLTLGAAACAHMFPPGTFRWLRDRFVALHPVGRAAVLCASAVVLKELSSPIIVPFIYFQF